MIPTFVIFGVDSCSHDGDHSEYIMETQIRVLSNLGISRVQGAATGSVKIQGCVQVLHAAVGTFVRTYNTLPHLRILFFDTSFWFPDTVVLNAVLVDDAFLAVNDGELVYASLTGQNAFLFSLQSKSHAAKWIRDNLQRLPNTLQIHRLESEA